MLFFSIREYQNAINEGHGKLVQVLYKYLIHEIREVD
jgi:hypothetical protein